AGEHERHRPAPRTGDIRTDKRADRARPPGRHRRIPQRTVRRTDVELSDAAVVSDDARRDGVSEWVDVPARQLHDVPASEPVLRQRTLWGRSAAAARRVRA